jgi:hypothetical protein
MVGISGQKSAAAKGNRSDKKTAQNREPQLTPLMRRTRNIGMKREAAKNFFTRELAVLARVSNPH